MKTRTINDAAFELWKFFPILFFFQKLVILGITIDYFRLMQSIHLYVHLESIYVITCACICQLLANIGFGRWMREYYPDELNQINIVKLSLSSLATDFSLALIIFIIGWHFNFNHKEILGTTWMLVFKFFCLNMVGVCFFTKSSINYGLCG
jgi:hypothetical protein